MVASRRIIPTSVSILTRMLSARVVPAKAALSIRSRPRVGIFSAERPARTRLAVSKSFKDQDGENDVVNSLISVTSAAALVVFAELAVALPALAEEAVTYDAAKGDFFKNAAGVGYLLLVGFFLARLFGRRSKFAKEYKLGSTPEEKAEAARRRQQVEPVTAIQSLISGIFASIISVAVFYVATQVDSFFETRDLPDNYTARNISVTIETIVRGLVYLASFIFGANAMGMLALGLRLVTDPQIGLPEAPPPPSSSPPDRDADLKNVSASSSTVYSNPVVGFFTGVETQRDDRSGTAASSNSQASASSAPPGPSISTASRSNKAQPQSSQPQPGSGFLSFNRVAELNDATLDLTERLAARKSQAAQAAGQEPEAEKQGAGAGVRE